METFEDVLQPGQGGREFIEHDAVVLHLGAESCGLEYACAVPVEVQGVDRGSRRCLVGQRRIGDRERQTGPVGQGRHGRVEPFVQGIQIGGIQQDALGHVNQPVMLAVEDAVDGGQRDVLVAPAVTADKMHAEQLVVIEARRRCGADAAGGLAADEVGTGVERLYAGDGGFEIETGRVGHSVIVGKAVRRRRMGHVEEEAVVDAQRDAGIHTKTAIGGGVAFDQRGGRVVRVDRGYQLRQAAGRAGDEIAVRIGMDPRDVVAVLVAEIEAELLAGLRLDGIPGWQAAVVRCVEDAVIAEAIEQITGVLQQIVSYLVVAHQDLGRRMRAIGLLLVDVRRRGVDETIVFVAQDSVEARGPRGAGHYHHVGSGPSRRRIKQRIVRLKRNHDDAVAALVDQAETVIEKLAEERHEGVGRCRQTFVNCRVGDEELVFAREVRTDILAAFGVRRGDRRRVRDRLVHNQMADQPWRGIDHGSGTVIAGAVLRVRKDPRRQERYLQIGRPEAFLARQQIIEGTIHRAQSPGDACVGQDVEQAFARGMPLGEFDLLENEIQIFGVEGEVRVARLRLRGLRHHPAEHQRRHKQRVEDHLFEFGWEDRAYAVSEKFERPVGLGSLVV